MADDPTWLLLHGTPLTPAVWDGVRPVLEQDHPVLAPFLPVPTAIEGAQRELAGAVLANLPGQTGPLHLVGHSFGAQVAIEVALLAPARLASLTLLCSRASPFPAFAGTAAALRQGVAPDPDASLQRWFMPAEVAADGAMVRYARTCIAGADHAMWADELDAIATYDRMADLRAIDVPTTVIAASADHVGTPEEMAAIAAALPRATFEEMADASHMSPFLDPTSLALRLRRHVSG